MKSYTDLEQSKELAEILPLESADMYYALSEDENMNMINLGKPQGFFDKTQVAWSLAALLNIIQKTTPYEMEYFGDKKVLLTCVLGDKPWELIISDFDNEVDTCFAMILKLHEEDLL